MAKKQKIPTLKELQKKFENAYNFNQQIGLYENVEVNENFIIGKQWEGVESNGLPTPVLNMLQQVVMFQVATISSDNMTIRATPLPSASPMREKDLETVCDVVSQQFAAILEREKIVSKCREYLRNAAVDGDGCMHFYFDPTIENGQDIKGEIKAEVIENTRVHFGNPNSKDVQSQPFIIISRREIAEDVQWRAEQMHEAGLNDVDDAEIIRPDSEKYNNKYDSYTDDKVTVLTYYFKNRDTHTIWCMEATEQCIIREAYDTEYTLYPLIWLNWHFIHDCYHGQAMITGLIPNQQLINKMAAMIAIHLISSAFPKYVYDKNRIKSWLGGVGQAIGVTGDVNTVAKVIEGAPFNPQVTQFIDLLVNYTRSFLGASNVALGDSRPDNTSAIVALQRAANTPMEMTKQNHYQCIEDMGCIFVDIMSVKYGTRIVEQKMQMDDIGQQPLGMNLPEQTFMQPFDFAVLKTVRLAIKQDVGASSYWSEMASMQTLDNLLMNHLITPEQYIERLPNGYITKRQKLLDEMRASAMASMQQSMAQATGISPENIGPVSSEDAPINPGGGNTQLTRALNREGA